MTDSRAQYGSQEPESAERTEAQKHLERIVVEARRVIRYGNPAFQFEWRKVLDHAQAALAALAAPSVAQEKPHLRDIFWDLRPRLADILRSDDEIGSRVNAILRLFDRPSTLRALKEVYEVAAPSVAPPQPVAEIGNASFEVREDEETGRRYWYGAEEGWKGGAEVGDDAGCLVMDPKQFAVGTRITMEEPINEQR